MSNAYRAHFRVDDIIYVKTLHLEWQGITEIDNLEVFEELESLNMQHNKIKRIEKLENNASLQFLSLYYNNVKVVENLSHLNMLYFLDLSNNSIRSFDPKEFPKSLLILKMQGNPCTTEMPDYRKSLVTALPLLEELDRIKVVAAERVAYMGMMPGLDVEQMLVKFKKER